MAEFACWQYNIVISIATLLCTVVLSIHGENNPSLSRDSKIWFHHITAAVVVCVVSSCIGGWLNEHPAPPIYNTLVTLIEYSVAPFISVFICGAYGMEHWRWAVGIMMSNIVFQLIACPFGLVYQITPDGAYTRGDFYIVYLTYVVISAVFAINSAIIFSKRFESTDYITLTVIIALVGVGCFAQYLNPGLKTAYVCVALAAMLFYIYSDDLIQKALVKQTQEQMEKASQTQHKLIVGLAEIIETRDENTGHHISRTVQYVKVLAMRAQNSGNYTLLTDDYVDMMLQCAFLHDVGKIAIPDAILNKPGKLTDEEFDVIKTHTIEGGRIIESILGEAADPDYLACGTEIATFHHEKWDGSGYPAGLSGESIPICARIMAIADVYDALTTERPYKKAMSTDEALEIIRKGSGTHFDPELTQMFLDSEDQIRRASLGLSYAAA